MHANKTTYWSKWELYYSSRNICVVCVDGHKKTNEKKYQLLKIRSARRHNSIKPTLINWMRLFEVNKGFIMSEHLIKNEKNPLKSWNQKWKKNEVVKFVSATERHKSSSALIHWNCFLEFRVHVNKISRPFIYLFIYYTEPHKLSTETNGLWAVSAKRCCVLLHTLIWRTHNVHYVQAKGTHCVRHTWVLERDIVLSNHFTGAYNAKRETKIFIYNYRLQK